jgi:hypothetical protein
MRMYLQEFIVHIRSTGYLGVCWKRLSDEPFLSDTTPSEEKLPRRVPVLVEKKEVPGRTSPTRCNTLDCLGVVSVGGETLKTYRLLYRLRATLFFTLSE